ncbi:MAG: hypothetical protein CL916_01845 [Deltaproteobacteria bacterium]|nr:hypothetical protein [Deltaproteobacteria bacterium]
MHKKIFGYALVYAFLSSVLASSYPVLDEESYLYIAQSMSLSRPYDWTLPWPPYTDSYRYAHPPLFLYWVWIATKIFGSSIMWMKFFLGFPFRLILGYSASWVLFHHTSSSKHKWSILAWMSSPIVLMVGARSMMPDLMFSALGMLAMMLYLSATEDQKRVRFLCGVFLGCSCWIKYPALLLWVPILFSYRTWKGMWPILAGFACTWGLGEVWLWSIYGQSHLAVVLSTADHVDRGPVWGRVTGFFMRLLLGMPFLLLLFRKKNIWSLLFVLPIAWIGTPDMSILGMILAVVWISVAVMAVVFCIRRMDFFSVWWITVFVGVCSTHNFSSPRYLILGMIPLVVLIMRECSEGGFFRYLILFSSLTLSALVAIFEHNHAKETWNLVQEIDVQAQYSGEWTFRWAMRQKGMQLWKGESVSVLVPKQAVGGSFPQGFSRTQVYTGTIGRRVLLDQAHSVGYYSEMLGFWPLGYQKGPIEEVYLWNP